MPVLTAVVLRDGDCSFFPAMTIVGDLSSNLHTLVLGTGCEVAPSGLIAHIASTQWRPKSPTVPPH